MHASKTFLHSPEGCERSQLPPLKTLSVPSMLYHAVGHMDIPFKIVCVAESTLRKDACFLLDLFALPTNSTRRLRIRPARALHIVGCQPQPLEDFGVVLWRDVEERYILHPSCFDIGPILKVVLIVVESSSLRPRHEVEKVRIQPASALSSHIEVTRGVPMPSHGSQIRVLGTLPRCGPLDSPFQSNVSRRCTSRRRHVLLRVIEKPDLELFSAVIINTCCAMPA